MLKIKPLGPLAAAGERVTHRRKARKYIMMIYTTCTIVLNQTLLLSFFLYYEASP